MCFDDSFGWISISGALTGGEPIPGPTDSGAQKEPLGANQSIAPCIDA